MNDEQRLELIKKYADETAILGKSIAEDLGKGILDVAARISGVIGAGGKLLIAGNGGSASQASHWAAEMIVRLTSDRNRQSLPAIALNVDPAVVTAAANDYGYDNIFARQVEGLGNKGDMLVALSTSGNSANLIKAVQAARDQSMISIGLLGGSGGKLGGMVDKALIVPHSSTQRVQEQHLFLLHTIVEFVEKDLFA